MIEATQRAIGREHQICGELDGAAKDESVREPEAPVPRPQVSSRFGRLRGERVDDDSERRQIGDCLGGAPEPGGPYEHLRIRWRGQPYVVSQMTVERFGGRSMMRVVGVENSDHDARVEDDYRSRSRSRSSHSSRTSSREPGG